MKLLQKWKYCLKNINRTWRNSFAWLISLLKKVSCTHITVMNYGAQRQNIMVFCRLQESLIFIVFFCSFNCEKYGLKKKLQKLHNIKFFKMSSYEDYSACREIVQFVSQLIFKTKKVNLEILTLFLLMAQGTLSVFEGSVFMCSLLIKEDFYQIHPSFH